MAKIVNALKELGKKCNTTAAVPNGNTIEIAVTETPQSEQQ